MASDLKTWLSEQRTDIKNALRLAEPGQRFFHISSDFDLKEMHPWISKRQHVGEDRTIPRICGSDSIVNCILGYAMLPDDRHEGVAVYAIYEVSGVELARPNKTLVPDCELTGELWIAPYGPDAYGVKPVQVGELLLEDVCSNDTVEGHRLSATFRLLTRTSLKVGEGLVKPGYYTITWHGPMHVFGKTYGGVKQVTNGNAKQHNEIKNKLLKLKKEK